MPLPQNTIEQLRQKVSDIELLEIEKSSLNILAQYPTILEGSELFVSVSVPSVATRAIQSIALKNLFTPSEIVVRALLRRSAVQSQIDLLLGNQGEINIPHED